MIIVTGSVIAPPERRAEALYLARTHVHRSRAEPGCLSHDVHIDAEDENRLVFLERWQDLAALRAHFALPATRAFGRALASLATAPGTMDIYQAQAVSP